MTDKDKIDSVKIAAAYVDLADQLLAQLPASKLKGIRHNRQRAERYGNKMLGKVLFQKLKTMVIP